MGINFEDERNPSIGIIIICVGVYERQTDRQTDTYGDKQVSIELTRRAGFLPG